MRVRWRVLIWLDETGGPLQAAMAKYVDDEKTRETTWQCGPFETPLDALDEALSRVDEQLSLPI